MELGFPEIKFLSVFSPEVSRKENYYCEQLKSTHYHQSTEIYFQYRMKQREIADSGSFSKGGSSI